MIRTFYALITGDKISVTILIIMIAFAVLLFKILSVIFSKPQKRREEAYWQKRRDELNKKLTEKYSSSPIVKAAAERFRSDGSFKELRVYKNGIALYRTSSKIPPSENFKSNKIVYSESESKKIVHSMAKEWEDKVSVIHRNSYNKDDVILYSDFGYEDACEDVRHGLTACLSVILNLPYGFHTGHFEHKYRDITPSSGYIISGNSVTPSGGSSKEYRSSLYLSAYGVVHTPPPEEEIQQPLKLKQW